MADREIVEFCWPEYADVKSSRLSCPVCQKDMPHLLSSALSEGAQGECLELVMCIGCQTTFNAKTGETVTIESPPKSEVDQIKWELGKQLYNMAIELGYYPEDD